MENNMTDQAAPELHSRWRKKPVVICKRVRHREDLTEDERCGVLEGALAIQDEIARLDQRKEEGE